MTKLDISDIKALTFDVFGTVVDWRASIIQEMQAFGARKGITHVDWIAFTDAWRGLYQPALSKVRDGQIGWVKLDILHRMNLDELVKQFNLAGLSEGELDHINRVWHRLNPWPDVVPGLARLKTRYILATLSNGNIALMVNLAKHSNLPWDVILGAEVARHYKPQPQVYLNAAETLDLRPNQCLMVAAHNGDLVAARGCGLRTAFVARPNEYGPHQSHDFKAEHDFDFIAEDFLDLAMQLGC